MAEPGQRTFTVGPDVPGAAPCETRGATIPPVPPPSMSSWWQTSTRVESTLTPTTRPPPASGPTSTSAVPSSRSRPCPSLDPETVEAGQRTDPQPTTAAPDRTCVSASSTLPWTRQPGSRTQPVTRRLPVTPAISSTVRPGSLRTASGPSRRTPRTTRPAKVVSATCPASAAATSQPAMAEASPFPAARYIRRRSQPGDMRQLQADGLSRTSSSAAEGGRTT
mmetsp:Transcript_21947/g.51792  ORF Transcript_21947/g.51792 Transcript_21947/m.51792 type:complete len:222 (-) Transcript_21947:231-896(-)